MNINKAKVKHKQQILFSDPELNSNNNKAKETTFVQEDTQQLLFENDVYQSECLEHTKVAELVQKQLNHDVENNNLSWPWRIILTLFTLVLLLETVDFFITGFEHSPVTTSIYAIILSCLGVVTSAALWREFSGVSVFKQRKKVKKQVVDLLKENRKAQSLEVAELCQKLTKNLPCDLVESQQKAWQNALEGTHTDSELLQLYSRIVLNQVDEKALNEVAKFSTEAVVLVGLSPVALIDMFILLSRNLHMINKVAGLYGLKLGFWSRIKLIKQVAVNMTYAGASEIISDLGSEMLGAELLGKLSIKFTQGLGAGMLTARLGIKTIQLCRPIPFDQKPKLAHIRKKVIGQIKSLVNLKPG